MNFYQKIIAFVVTASFAVMSVAFYGCSKPVENSNSESEESAMSITSPSNNSYTEYKNSYCTFYFPAKYTSIIKTEENDNQVNFIAELKGIKQILFTIYFNKDKGYELGTLKTDKGEIKISIENPKLQEEKSWTENDYDLLNEMRDSVNTLLDKLWENENFTPSKAPVTDSGK